MGEYQILKFQTASLLQTWNVVISLGGVGGVLTRDNIFFHFHMMVKVEVRPTNLLLCLLLFCFFKVDYVYYIYYIFIAYCVIVYL